MQDEESYLDQPIELDPFEDGGTDDAESSDLLVGEEIDVLSETAIGDNEPIELDLGTLVGLDDARSDAESDHDSGFELDPETFLSLPDALTPDDDKEGLDDGAITVDESKFPALEMDDGSEGVAAEREISLGSVSDEVAVATAEVPFRAVLPMPSLEACSALAIGPESVVAGSSDLLWFRSDSPTPLRLAVDGSRLSDLVLLGAAQDIALTSTQSGQLFRRARYASQTEQVTRFREPLKAAPGSRVRLSFGGELGRAGGRVLLWSNNGALLEVCDAGDRFERVALGGQVIAAARESATVLLSHARERRLVSLQGTRHDSRVLSGSADLVARTPAPLLATAGDSVALAECGQALLVSADRGQTFRRVPGCASITALAGASVSGSPRFFAALYRETTDQSELLLVDPERGEAVCIARLALPEPGVADAVDRGEWAKVACLAWHADAERLWAAGGFGVVSFSPSSSD